MVNIMNVCYALQQVVRNSLEDEKVDEGGFFPEASCVDSAPTVVYDFQVLPLTALRSSAATQSALPLAAKTCALMI